MGVAYAGYDPLNDVICLHFNCNIKFYTIEAFFVKKKTDKLRHFL